MRCECYESDLTNELNVHRFHKRNVGRCEANVGGTMVVVMARETVLSSKQRKETSKNFQSVLLILMASFKTSLVMPSLSCIHIHSLSSD